jgi:outer membrane lipoprotein-sorting protein
MTTPDRSPSDDILARAEASLRSMSVPDGPSHEVASRILAALHAAPEVAARRRPGGGIARWALRLAAAVLLAVGLGTLAGTWLLRPAAALAEVAQKLRDARTLSYRTTSQVSGQLTPVVQRMLIKAPGLIRAEAEGGPTYTLFDASRNRTLVVDRKSRSALLLEGPAPAEKKTTDMAAKEVEGLRRLAESKGELVGRRRIGKVEATGFRVRQGWQDLVVWLDPRAKLPVRVDLKARVNDMEVTGSLTDFQIDPPLDDALFRFEPPAGYTLTKGENASMSEEGAITELLRTYAERADGRFPQRLDDWRAYSKQLPKDELVSITKPKVARLYQVMARVQVFLLEHKDEFGYTPEGVKLGDADKILLWLRPKGSAGYRAIFGDLHAESVTRDRLPDRGTARSPADRSKTP